MARLAKLGVKEVEALVRKGEPKMAADGGGLYLRVRPGAASWVFVSQAGGKRAEIAIGPYASIRLARARAIAAEMREVVASGRDPRKVVAPPEPEPEAITTFWAFAERYIARVEGGWKNAVHRAQWRQSLRDHAGPILDKPLAEITTTDVLAVLQPIWLDKPETASRVRGRIEKILGAALAEGLIPRPYENPARWKGHLEHSLLKPERLSRGHHAALPYDEAPAFMARLRERPALAARCLEFTILTAARSGEALGATWGEIDMEAAVWTVPKERMKARREHRVPLSPAALAILEAQRPADPKPGNKVFAVAGAPRSNMAMTMLLRRMGAKFTVHGFRSTFRDWAGDATGHSHQVIEAALAHTIQNKAEAAYRRSDAFEKRRRLMEDWAGYLAGTSGANVVPIRAAS